MRLLVTGAGGLLGTAVVREFSADCQVVAFDRRGLDITDPHAIATAVRKAAPDLVINCAAFNAVDAAEEQPAAALEANAFAVLQLARAADSAGARFVHYSSDFVFDGESDRPYTEADRPNPRSVYGASKLLGDLFALEFPRAYVLRVESLFGPPNPGGRRGSLGTMVDQIRDGREVPVFTDRTVSPSYTPDVARATRTLIQGDARSGLYHCVNSGHARWHEIARRVAEVLGLSPRLRLMTLDSAGLRARRPRYCALSNEKLVKAGCPMRTWESALLDFLA